MKLLNYLLYIVTQNTNKAKFKYVLPAAWSYVGVVLACCFNNSCCKSIKHFIAAGECVAALAEKPAKLSDESHIWKDMDVNHFMVNISANQQGSFLGWQGEGRWGWNLFWGNNLGNLLGGGTTWGWKEYGLVSGSGLGGIGMGLEAATRSFMH